MPPDRSIDVGLRLRLTAASGFPQSHRARLHQLGLGRTGSDRKQPRQRGSWQEVAESDNNVHLRILKSNRIKPGGWLSAPLPSCKDNNAPVSGMDAPGRGSPLRHSAPTLA
jgi:hypothetical protein